MREAALQLVFCLLVTGGCAQSPSANRGGPPAALGENAMEHARAQVALGPRSPGTEANRKCREYLKEKLVSYGYVVEEDAFETETPYGRKMMVNLIARTGPGDRGVLALASHYDTKYMEGIRFVGANDGASSTGLLLELARVLAGRREGLDYWFLFLDGEEAFIEWSSFDSTYGSRHLARRWKSEGTAVKVKALILLDMIGDRDLDILRETHSTRWLRDLVWSTASEIGLEEILSSAEGAVEDDHIPFLDIGIAAVDLIDLNFGPGNSFHHTEHDTLDKVSKDSLEKVGRLTLAVLAKLQERFSR